MERHGGRSLRKNVGNDLRVVPNIQIILDNVLLGKLLEFFWK